MASEVKKAMDKSQISFDDDAISTKPSSPLKSDANPATLNPVKIQPNDIVFGRGKGYHGHHGNEKMRQIVDKYKMQYHAIDRSQKRELVEVVYHEIIQDGARFLVKGSSSDGYVEAGRIMALQKVSNALRCKKSFKRETTAASSPDKNPSLPEESNAIASALASRPLHEGLSWPNRGAGGLASLESSSFMQPNNLSNLFASSLLPWSLRTPSLRGDILSAVGIDAGTLSLSGALRSDFSANQEQARRNLALDIPNPSSLLYARTPASLQPSLDQVALLRQELLLQQLGVASLGRSTMAGGSITNDLSNHRLIMEELASPRAVQRNMGGNKDTESKNSQRKNPGL
ncbi:unnamed protein product [Cylindrotheca closterium]|uniref:DUF6824 domain-containing protein n=1 Tax=Cylindrotheca closterium TaxID=2856 RepID=A0AAD2FW93_9STRA|nr:unnamed protein product [Cylindrotheca closterium]